MSHLPLISQEFVLAKHAPEKGTDYLVIPFLVWITCQPWAKCQQNVQESWHICLWLVTLVSRTQCPSHSLLESPVSCCLFLDPFLPTVRGGGFALNLLKCSSCSPSISLISFPPPPPILFFPHLLWSLHKAVFEIFQKNTTLPKQKVFKCLPPFCPGPYDLVHLHFVRSAWLFAGPSIKILIFFFF